MLLEVQRSGGSDPYWRGPMVGGFLEELTSSVRPVK